MTAAAKPPDVEPGMQHHHWFMRVLVACCSIVLASNLAAQQERRWAITAAPQTVIGDAFAEDEYMFEKVVSARFLPDGRIAVADNGPLQIRIYGQDGTFQKRIGRRGGGPGEFQYITGMWLTSKGTLGVYDGRIHRITILSSRGEVVSTQQLSGSLDGRKPEVFFGWFANDDIVLASLFGSVNSAQPTPDVWKLGRFGLNGELKAPLGQVRGMWRQMGQHGGGPVPFTPLPATVVYRDSLYVADGYESAITVRSTRGVPVRTISLPRAREVSADAVWSTFEAEVRQRNKDASSQSLKFVALRLEKNDFPRQDEFPQVGGLVTDDRGYIWAKDYDPFRDALYFREFAMLPAGGGEWRVIRPDGGVVTTVRVPDGVIPLEIKGNRLLGVKTDELGVARIVVHTIQR